LGLACAYRVFSRELVGFSINGVYQEYNYPLLPPSFLFQRERRRAEAREFSQARSFHREEGKGGKAKSQVAYDTVLEIGGKLDDGV